MTVYRKPFTVYGLPRKRARSAHAKTAASMDVQKCFRIMSTNETLPWLGPVPDASTVCPPAALLPTLRTARFVQPARARAYRGRHQLAIAGRRAQRYAALDPQQKKERSRLNAVAVLVRRGSLVRRPCELCDDADVRPYFSSPEDPARAVRWLCRICMPYADTLPPPAEYAPRPRKHRRSPTVCRNGHPRLTPGPCPRCRNERMTRYRQHRADRVRRSDRARKRSLRVSPRYQLLRARQRIAAALANRAIPAPTRCETDGCRNVAKLAAILDPAEEARAPLGTGWWWMCPPCAAQWIATHEERPSRSELPMIVQPRIAAGKVLDNRDLARIDAELSAYDERLESIVKRINIGVSRSHLPVRDDRDDDIDG